MLDRLWARAGRALAFRMEPETAHEMAITGLKSGALSPGKPHHDPRLATVVASLRVANPVGVAAGFDKNGEVPAALLKLGFGLTEVGTITPRAQSGNDKPRIFRLPDDHGVINRLGFNNEGHEAAFNRLSALRERAGPIGVNIGTNKDAVDRAGDYAEGIRRFHALADYFTVNISSPNTPGLRDLQARDELDTLLTRIRKARGECMETSGKAVPVFVKIAPDISSETLDDILEQANRHNIDGLVISNTTLSRAGLRRDPGEAGGLSGRPVFERSTIILAHARKRVGKDMALIGVGGVDDARSALAKIEAGADLVQLYTGMIYHGPGLARDITRGLSAILDERGVSRIGDLRDARVDEWAAKPFPV